MPFRGSAETSEVFTFTAVNTREHDNYLIISILKYSD
jgi:hypothetical protein